jgi:hypothetical protein
LTARILGRTDWRGQPFSLRPVVLGAPRRTAVPARYLD